MRESGKWWEGMERIEKKWYLSLKSEKEWKRVRAKDLPTKTLGLKVALAC